VTPGDRPERLRRRPLGRYRYVRLRWRVLFALVDLIGGAVFAAARRLRRLMWAVCSPGFSRILPPEGGTTNFPPASKTLRSRGALFDPDATRAILLVQLDHLGDAVISTAMLGPLRSRYRQASIEVLASTANREVFQVAAEVDRVYVSRVNRFARGALWKRLGWVLAMVGWGLRLRRRRYDLAVDVRGDFPVAVILWLSGARRRLGWECGGGGFLLTDRAEFAAGRAEVASRLALLEPLGIRPTADDGQGQARRSCPAPVFRPSQSARQLAAGVFEHSSGRLPSGPRVVAQVGAGTPAKRWPAEHWRELIGLLVDRHGASVALVGDRAEQAVARAVRGPHPPPNVPDWTGRLSVDELAAVLEAADVFVGPDSGPAHLAAAVGTPVVVLFSGTNDPRQWQPSGRAVRVLRHLVPCSPCHRSRCPRADHACMRALAPRRVVEAVEELAAFNRQPTALPLGAQNRNLIPDC